MHLVFLLVVCAAIQTVNAQSSATVYVQPSTGANSYSGYMSTSFIGLKLPSGTGTHVSITVTPGDYADYTFDTSYADHTQAGPYVVGGSSTSFTIGQTGHYWFYLSVAGTTSNYDYMEIRVEASTWSGSVPCYYCAPPSGWQSGWPPLGTHLLAAPAPGTSAELPASQPTSSSSRMPTWLIPILAVIIAFAVFVPTSYMIYRYVQSKKEATAAQAQTTNVAPPTIVIEKTTQCETNSNSAIKHETTNSEIKHEHIELQPVTVV